MSALSGPDTPVLAPRRADFRGSVRWLLWPALQFRVITPLVQEQQLNALQRAVLGLCSCGLRDPDELGNLLGLTGGLVELVLADLSAHRYVSEHHTVTELGRQTLRDGYLDPSRTVVTHVYQDPFTGQLWSAAPVSPQWIEARWEHVNRARLALGSAGDPVDRYALAVQADPTQRPNPPSAEEVLTAVVRAERAERIGNRRRGADRTPPDRVTRRVSMVSDRPVAVYLPLVVLATGGASEAGPGMTTWLAMSPFTGRKSAFARHLVATTCAEREELRLVVEKVLGRPTSSLLAECERLNVEKRRVMEESVERRFTSRVHTHRELLDLLTMLEFYAAETGTGHQRTEDREHAVRYAWRCFELMLRRVVRDRPVAELVQQRRPKQRDRRTQQERAAEEAEFRHRLASDAQRVGLNYGDARRLDGASRDSVGNAMVRPATTTTPVLIAAAVLSAANQPERHPISTVAQARPRLIADLMYLSTDRNDVSHEAPADLHGDLVVAARKLAHEFAEAFLAADTSVPHGSAAAERERTPADV